MCIHLHKSGQDKGEAAAALTGAPATAEAASAEDYLKVELLRLCTSSASPCCCAVHLRFAKTVLADLMKCHAKTLVPLNASSPSSCDPARIYAYL